jgi:SAM-dependent methyltransferase
VRPIDRLLGRLSAQLPDAVRAQLARLTRAHRKFVARPGSFDLAAASQFALLALLGLREHHHLLEIGCGSLRAGRLFLVYLEPGRYHAVEPERWLIDAAIDNEIGRDLVRLKRPVFDHGRDFRFGVFGRKFDFVVAGSVFSHAAPAQIRACLGEAARVLAPDGLFLASWLEGPSDSTNEEWIYPERAAYTAAFLRRAAAEAGLDCVRLDWPYDFGAGEQSWLAFALPAGGAEEAAPR